MYRYFKTLCVHALMLVFIISCAGATTAISKRNLDVENKMSASIFLDPVAPEERTIFVQVRNTSDNKNFNIENQVVQALRAKGYIVTQDPNKAQYMLQANVLSVGQSNKLSRDQMMEDGFGGAVSGAALGAGAGALASKSNHSDAVIGGALAGAVIGTVVNAAVKDVTYSVVTDVQVSQRSKNAIHAKTTSELKQGTSGKTTTTSSANTDWERFQTRIVSTANKVNLKIEQATPELVDGVSQALAGIF